MTGLRPAARRLTRSPRRRGDLVRPDECIFCGGLNGEKDSGRAWVCGVCREPYSRTTARRRQARRRARLRLAHAFAMSRAVRASEAPETAR